MLEWGLTIGAAILSGVLLSGHGAFLIAGYNTSGKEDKARYDEKKLCRVMGSGFSVIAVLLAVMSLLGEDAPAWFGVFFGAVVLADVIILVIVTNSRYCLKDVQSEKTLESAEEAAKKKKIMTGSLIFTAIIFLFVGVMLFTGEINIKYGEDSFTIEASYWADKTIAYEDIESLEFVSDMKAGSRTNGFGSFRLWMGWFKNDALGKYIRYTYAGCEENVVLQVNGSAVVLSGKDGRSTEKIYENLKEKTGL